MTDLKLPDAATGPEARGSQTAALVKRQESVRPDVPWAELAEVAAKARASGLMPQSVKSDTAAIVIMAKGHELGLPALQALEAIHVVKGRPTLEAKLMLGLAYKNVPGFAVQLVELTRKGCTLKMRRAGGPWSTITYDEGDAKQAGLLSKENWRAHPKAMYLARAEALGVRLVAPDYFSRTYTPEEASAIEDAADIEVFVDPIEPAIVPASDEPAQDVDFDVADPEPATSMADGFLKELSQPQHRESVQRIAKEWGLTGSLSTQTEATLSNIHAEVFG